jgi:Polyketide cyclase / dehydrase and lipid transport
MQQGRSPAIFLLLLAAPAFCLASPGSAPSGPSDGWTLSSESNGIILYSRPRPGSRLKEFKAVGEIEAPAPSVHGVIDDIDAYSSFMPFMTECRLIKRESDSIITYQRLSPKICRDRDYTLRVRETSWAGANGLVYLNKWEPANELGPAQKKGVIRVNLCEGGWLLEPEEGATKTRATYTVYTDNGGAIPAFIANSASKIAIGRLFVALREKVKDPKYKVSELSPTR